MRTAAQYILQLIIVCFYLSEILSQDFLLLLLKSKSCSVKWDLCDVALSGTDGQLFPHCFSTVLTLFYLKMTGRSEQKAPVAALERVFLQILSETRCSAGLQDITPCVRKCGGWWMSVSISAGTVKWQLSVTVTSRVPAETHRLQVAPFSKSHQECGALNSPLEGWRALCAFYIPDFSRKRKPGRGEWGGNGSFESLL